MDYERENHEFDHIKKPERELVVSEVEPPAYLFGRIMKSINAEKKILAAQRKAAFFAFALAGSATAFLGAFFVLEGALIQSELFKLISIIVSDPGIAAANWQDFALFVAESTPVASFALFLTALFALLGSLTYLAKYNQNSGLGIKQQLGN